MNILGSLLTPFGVSDILLGSWFTNKNWKHKLQAKPPCQVKLNKISMSFNIIYASNSTQFFFSETDTIICNSCDILWQLSKCHVLFERLVTVSFWISLYLSFIFNWPLKWRFAWSIEGKNKRNRHWMVPKKDFLATGTSWIKYSKLRQDKKMCLCIVKQTTVR